MRANLWNCDRVESCITIFIDEISAKLYMQTSDPLELFFCVGMECLEMLEVGCVSFHGVCTDFPCDIICESLKCGWTSCERNWLFNQNNASLNATGSYMDALGNSGIGIPIIKLSRS